MRRWLLMALRIAVTIGAIVWVVGRIHWKDRVVLPDRSILEGAEAERWRSLHPEPEAGGDAGLFQPGLRSSLVQVRYHPGYLLTALAILPLTILWGAIRWRELMRAHDLDPGFATSLRLTWVGTFWNQFLPGATGGDLVKAYSIARNASRKTVSVLIVFLDRVIGLIALAGLSGMAILAQFARHSTGRLPDRLDLQWQSFEWASLFILIFLLVTFIAAVVFFSRRLRRLLGIEYLLQHELLPFRPHVERMDQTIFHYRAHKRTVVETLGLSVLAHSAMILAFFFVGRSLGMQIGLMHYIIFVPVIMTISSLPVSMGGLGVMEGGFQHFFTLPALGANSSNVLALCLLYRVLMLLVSLPGGCLPLKQIQPPEEEPVATEDGRSASDPNARFTTAFRSTE